MAREEEQHCSVIIYSWRLGQACSAFLSIHANEVQQNKLNVKVRQRIWERKIDVCLQIFAMRETYVREHTPTYTGNVICTLTVYRFCLIVVTLTKMQTPLPTWHCIWNIILNMTWKWKNCFIISSVCSCSAINKHSIVKCRLYFS